jgi:hypothetical protein
MGPCDWLPIYILDVDRDELLEGARRILMWGVGVSRLHQFSPPTSSLTNRRGGAPAEKDFAMLECDFR